MQRGLAPLVLPALLAWAFPAAAENGSVPDDPIVDRTIAAMAANDRAELEWLVSQVGSIQFPRQHFQDRGEVFAALSGCKAKPKGRMTAADYRLYQFEWKCPDGRFVGRLVPDKGGHSVAIVDIFPKAEFEANAKRIPTIMFPPQPIRMPPVRPLSAEAQAAKDAQERELMERRTALATQFAEGFATGDLSAFAGRHVAWDRILFGFEDPFLDQPFVEKVWVVGAQRSDADTILAEAGAMVRDRFGPPRAWECVGAAPYVDCTWSFDDPHAGVTAHMLMIRPGEYDWGYKIFRFEYWTAEKLAEAERRAGAR